MQVSAHRTEQEAQEHFRALKARYPKLLNSRSPILARKDLGSKGVFELGVRFDQIFPVGAVVALRARAAWAHDWVTEATATAGFQALPGAFFIVNGASPAENSALVSSGAELRLANGIALGGRFEGEFASESQTYAGFRTVRYGW